MANIDVRPNNPYREVEMYLQKAEEEICITLRELNDRNKNGKRQQVVPTAPRRTTNGIECGSDHFLASTNGNNKSEVCDDSASSSNSTNNNNNVVGRLNVRHSSSTSTINSCKKQTVNHPLPPPRKRNFTKQSPRLVHFMQSLRVLPAWTDDDDEYHHRSGGGDFDDKGLRSSWINGGNGHLNSKNGNLVGVGSSNIIRERSVSVKELPQSSRVASSPSSTSVTAVPSSTAMLNSSSDFWSVNGGGGYTSASVCNLDFSSTESVNRWFSHMLAELDSIPNVSYTDDATDDFVSDSEDCCSNESVGKLDRHSIAGVETVDSKLQEACSGLRDIGRFDVCSSSKSSSSLCSSSSTQIFRSSNEKLFNKSRSSAVDDDGYDIYDNNSATCMIHSDDKSTRSSYTWPLEQTKSSSLTNRNDDDEPTNGRTSTAPQPLLASTISCEIYRRSASETTTVINSQRRSSKDLTPTPSLDDIYSSVTPLASPDFEKKLTFDRNYCHSNNTFSSSSSSPPLKTDLSSSTATNEFVCVKEKTPPPPTASVQKTDVATEVSNSLKMQQHHQSPSKMGARSDVAAYRQWPIINNSNHSDSIKPKKNLAQEYASTNVLSITNGVGGYNSQPNHHHRYSQKQSTEINSGNGSFQAQILPPPSPIGGGAGGNSIRGVVARIIKLAESEISSPKIEDRRSFKCRSAQYSVDGDDFLDDNNTNSNLSLCNSQQFIECHDACTQTTPFSLSRSSSFTWMSEGEAEIYGINRSSSKFSERRMAESSNSDDNDEDDDDDNCSINSTTNDDEQIKRDGGERSLCLSELSGADSSDDVDELLANTSRSTTKKLTPITIFNNDLRPNLDKSKFTAADVYSADAENSNDDDVERRPTRRRNSSNVVTKESTDISHFVQQQHQQLPMDRFGESLQLLLEATDNGDVDDDVVLQPQAPDATRTRRNYNNKVSNFTTALEAAAGVVDKHSNKIVVETNRAPLSSSSSSVVKRSSFSLDVGINSKKNETNGKPITKLMDNNGSSSEDVIYDNLPNVRRHHKQTLNQVYGNNNCHSSVNYRSELLESSESPMSATDFSESFAIGRDVSVTSGLLTDSESSPLADSESSPMSPIVDGFGILDSLRSNGDGLKPDSINSFTSSEGSFNLIQAAPEFQYKTGEDYAKECQKEQSMRAVVDCFSSIDDECDIAESVLIRRNRTTNSPPYGENKDFGKKYQLQQQQKRSNSNHNGNAAISPTAAAALLCAEMKHIMAGSMPMLDRIRDADDLIRANYGFGDGSGFGGDLSFKDGRDGVWTNKASAEKEARQCCRWLRAAGFPQYAKLYEDHQFPIDVKSVQKDHEFLDSDSLQALFRRLQILNQCAVLKLEDDSRARTPDDDSDDDDPVPLSRRWKFIRKSRTWSRIVNEIGDNVAEIEINMPTDSSSLSPPVKTVNSDRGVDVSFDSLNGVSSLEKSNQRQIINDSLMEKHSTYANNSMRSSYQSSRSTAGLARTAEDIDDVSPKLERKLQRSQSERIKDKAKAFVKRMDFRNKQRRKSPAVRERSALDPPPIISSPVSVEHCVTGSSSLHSARMFGDVNVMFNKGKELNSYTSASSASGSMSPARPRAALSHTSSSDERRRGRVFPSVASVEFEKVDVNGLPTGYSAKSSQQQKTVAKGHNIDNIFVPNLPNATSNVSSIDQRYLNGRRPILDDEEKPRHIKRNTSNRESNRVGFEQPLQKEYFESDSSPEIHAKSASATASSLRVEVEIEQHSNANRQQLHSSYDSSDTETAPYWERRDSGVGSSLSRSPSAPSKPRVRWHSFQRQHRPTTVMEKSLSSVSMDSLSLSQMMTLQKYALLKLTALMEKYSPSHKTSGWHWGVQKLFKRMKSADQKLVRDKQIFGVPLTVIAQRTGQPLPQCILHSMRYLRKQSLDTVGIFRKSGVRSRIQKLKVQCEASNELVEYDSQQAYDVADTVKQYFRDLPEPLLTSKLSETFVAIHLNVPEHLRMEAMQKAVLLLPDENREALHSFVHFLHDIAAFSDTNQMTAQNLAVCLAPTLFQLSSRNMAMSPQRRHKTITGGLPNEKELNENRAAQACLAVMIDDCRRIFTVPEDVMMRCTYSTMDQEEPAYIGELGLPHGNYNTYLNGCIDILLREHRERWRGWVTEGTCDGVEMSSKKVADGHLLKLWRCWVDVEAPPKELLHRVLRERDSWDDDIIKWRVVRKLSESAEVFQYVCNDMPPHPTRDYCVVRKWLLDLAEIRGGCILVETSVAVPEAPKMGGVRGVVLASRYLIEPSGAGRSRITHVARIDAKGRSKSWYNKIFGYVCANQIARIRDSFRQLPDGPETKV